ncbi:MAG: hypothetical protein D6765_06000 [Bacteroidetes bacterium]|nr:MAG: hypothetical protein D6765_06000 [Bacteroidota bacterium]
MYFQGALLGLGLSLLMGPILFTLVQTSLEQGFRAGMMVGVGIWVSDVLFIGVVLMGVSYLLRVVEWQGFEPLLGTAGGVLLAAVGAVMLMKERKKGAQAYRFTSRSSSYFSLWLKGFLINSLNPFTFFFWAGVATTLAIKHPGGARVVLPFYAGVFSVIVLTDAMKVGLAKLIRRWLHPRVIFWSRVLTGLVLLGFGIFLLARVFWMMAV